MPRSNTARKQGHPGGRAVNAAAAAVLSIGALAAIGASPASAVVNGRHVIAPLYVTSGLELSGYSSNTTLLVTASRNGATLSTATVTTDSAGNAAVNGGAVANGNGCWTGTTPGLLPGDTISVANDGATPDSMRVQNVTAGRPVAAANGDIIVQGTAVDLVTGGQVPVTQVESRLKTTGAFANGKKVLRTGPGGDGVLVYDPNATTWTATFSGLSLADRDTALNAESRGVMFPLLSEVTISQNPGAPGPLAPCTAPLAATGIGGVTPSAFNIANTVTTPTDLTVSGPSTADITSVGVSVGGGAVHNVTPSAGTWSATIPASEVSALPQGSSSVTATFTGGATAPGPQTRTIFKDTVAPAAPTATPAPDTYASSQSVTITGEAGASIHYTNDGSTPTASSLTASEAIPVTSSQTLKAVAVDSVGNVGALGTFAYVISPPPPPNPASGAGAGTPAPAAGTPAPAAGTPAPAAGALVPFAPVANTGASRPVLRLASLRTAARLTQFKARHSGIRLTIGVPTGTEVLRINVYRLARGKLTLLSSGFKVPSSAGVYRATQNQPALRRLLKRGSYQVQITPGYAKAELGTTSKASVKVT